MSEFRLEVTARWPAVKVVSNWLLGLAELLCRNPVAEFFLMAQDDLIACADLREYMERSAANRRGVYYNLFSFREQNEEIVARNPPGWHEAGYVNQETRYHGKLAQTGRGAVALVFDRDGVIELLTHLNTVVKPLAPGDSAHIRIDGMVVESMNMAGYRELISAPSLVQHTGDVSTIRQKKQQHALTFRSEKWSAMSLLQ